MSAHDELLLWHALSSLEARYWHDVDFNYGRRADEFYRPDGVMVVGHNRFEGRDKIREFYQWRERQAVTAVSSVKTMRHLISNLVVEASGEGRANVLGVISFYGAAAKPPVSQSKPPMLIADLINECVREGGTWQFQSHTLRPVFMSDEAPLSIAVDTRR
jgi:SnoaL-like domain